MWLSLGCTNKTPEFFSTWMKYVQNFAAQPGESKRPSPASHAAKPVSFWSCWIYQNIYRNRENYLYTYQHDIYIICLFSKPTVINTVVNQLVQITVVCGCWNHEKSNLVTKSLKMNKQHHLKKDCLTLKGSQFIPDIRA